VKNCGCRPKPHHVAGGALPAVVITLLPKCPACLAAYLVLGSGLAISAGAVAFVELLFVLLVPAPASLSGSQARSRNTPSHFCQKRDPQRKRGQHMASGTGSLYGHIMVPL
jgi:hypothetical protein